MNRGVKIFTIQKDHPHYRNCPECGNSVVLHIGITHCDENRSEDKHMTSVMAECEQKCGFALHYANTYGSERNIDRVEKQFTEEIAKYCDRIVFKKTHDDTAFPEYVNGKYVDMWADEDTLMMRIQKKMGKRVYDIEKTLAPSVARITVKDSRGPGESVDAFTLEEIREDW